MRPETFETETRSETFETETESRKNGSRDEPQDRNQVSRLHHRDFDWNYHQLRLWPSHLSVRVEQNSLLKSFVRIVFYTSAIRNAFVSHKLPNIRGVTRGLS